MRRACYDLKTIGGSDPRGFMNWLDLLIIAIVAWTTLRAFSAGLIREVVTFISLIVGVTLAGSFYDDLAANLEFAVTDATARQLLSFAAIFVGTMIAGAVVAAVLRSAASMLFLGPLDRAGGAVFGLLKGVLLVQVLLVAISVFPAQATLTHAASESSLVPTLLRFTPAIQAALPPEFQDPLGQLRRLDLSNLLPLPGTVPADVTGARTTTP